MLWSTVKNAGVTAHDQAPAPAKARDSLSWTSGVRGVCAVIVIGYHALLTPLPDGLPGNGQLFVQALGLAGHTAVLVFVAMSGYLLGRSWQRRMLTEPLVETTRDFLVRRSWRILPSYWVAVLLTIAAMLVLGLDEPEGTHWDTGLPFSWGKAVLDLLLLSDFAGQVPLSHPLWTVPVEFHLYFTVPLIALLRGRAAVTALGVVGSLAIVVLAPGFAAPFFFFAFVVSYWVGGQSRQTDRPALRQVLGPLVVVAVVMTVAAVVFGDLHEGPRRYLMTDTVAWALVLGWLYCRDDGRNVERGRLDIRLLSHPALVWLGNRSFSFYLVHALMLELAWRFAVVPLGVPGAGLQWLAVAVLGFALSALGAEVLWRTVEKPTMLRTRRLSPLARGTTDR